MTQTPRRTNSSNKSENNNCIEFSYEQMSDATHNFSDKPLDEGGCKLGEGGFGPVFKGKLLYTTVAIKKLRQEGSNLNTDMAKKQFRTEVNILTRFRHPNLLTLIGFCIHETHFCLVYEYMSNGTLEDALANSTSEKMLLPWEIRMSIACDTARGLLYLHTADHAPLVHRDVKSANVLLDISCRAKLGDFGLARPLDTLKDQRTKHVVGTSGYIPPEYYRGTITTKMDSYGFGVILLEIITGLGSYDSERDPNDLITYMQPYLSNKEQTSAQSIMMVVDGTSGRWPTSSIYGLFQIAKECLQDNMHNRSEIKDIYEELEQNLVDASVANYKFEKKRKHK